MNLIIDTVEKLKEEGSNIDVIVGPRNKYEKEKILESIKKIKDSGDEVKLEYVNNLYRYYSIFLNLNHLVRSKPILVEKEFKYHCETFLHFLEDTVIDNSKRIITGIITAVANDEPLDSFFKYLMRPDIYEEEYRRDEENKYQVKDDDTSEEENDDDTSEEENDDSFGNGGCRKDFYLLENHIQDENRKKNTLLS